MPDFAGLGLREALWLAAGLVAAYLVLLLARLRRAPPDAASPAAERRAEPAIPGTPPSLRMPPGEPDGAPFARELAHSAAGLEVQRLRSEVAQLRGEVARLGDEIVQLKATQSVSPLYSEAMSMAQRGELPSAIAARCGISIGEAELVAALGRKEFRAAVASELAEAEDGGKGRETGWTGRATR